MIAYANIGNDGAQESHAHGKLAALRLLFRSAGVTDTDGQRTHITHIFPGTTHYGTHFSTESAEDSSFNFSHYRIF